MRTIYIDSDYMCHINNDGTMRTAETDAFDGKCDAFVEGYRFVPDGESWMREDGVVFHGEMIAPWRSSAVLEAAQAQYEKDFAELMAEYQRGVDSAYD
jgi:hypothetical protein